MPAFATAFAPAVRADEMLAIGLNAAGYRNVIPKPCALNVLSGSPPPVLLPPPQAATPSRSPATPSSSRTRRRIATKLAAPERLETLQRAQRLVAGAVQLGARLGRRLAVEEVLDLPVEEHEEPADPALRRRERDAVLVAGEPAERHAPTGNRTARQVLDHPVHLGLH